MILEIIIGACAGVLLGVGQFFLTSAIAAGRINRIAALLIKAVAYVGLFLLMVLWSVAALLSCAIASLVALFCGVVYRYRRGDVQR